MSQPKHISEILQQSWTPEQEAADRKLREQLAAEKGETLYPEPEGTFVDMED